MSNILASRDNELNEVRKRFFRSCLLYAGLTGRKNEISASNAAITAFASYETFLNITSIVFDIYCDYFSLSDFVSFVITSKVFNKLRTDQRLWQIMFKEVEDQDQFIRRYCNLHSWYKHLGSGRDFYFTLHISEELRGYGEVINASHYKRRFGLHWRTVWDNRPSVPASMVRKVKLNCLLGKRNLSIAFGCVKGEFLEELLEYHKTTISELEDQVASFENSSPWGQFDTYSSNKWEVVLAKKEFTRMANEMKSGFSEIAELVFASPPMFD